MSRTKLALLRIFAWFHLFGVPALVSTTTGNTDISNLARPSARVNLFSFERGLLRTLTDSVDTEVVLTQPPKYFEAYLFECNATYPVQWAYIGEAAPVVTADVGRFFKDFYDINTYTYQSILLMYSLQEMQSGRYICRGASKEHDKLAIHYDVFVPGNATQILLSTKEKKLFVPESKEHVYIPCGTSDSTAVVNLYRGNQWGTFYPVPVNGSITFNPRKGFKIRFKDFLDPWGTYLCVSSSNKRRRKVHLIPESLKAKYDLINHVNGKIPVYFSYEYEHNRVLCCTGTNFIPKLQWAGCGSILDCQVKSACFEEDRCEQRLGNSGYNPTKWIDPGPLPPGCSGYRLRDDPNGDFGLFKCSTPGIAQYQPYLLNRGNIFLDFEKTPPSEMILTLQRISREGPSFVGDEVEFHCNSTRFYFAYGIRWGWEKLMGEIEFIDDATVIRDKYSVRGHRRRTTFRIPHSDIKSIICFVPVVNSATEWRTVSLPMVIAASDINYIQHPNPVNPANNVIDLDSITYHTDYDADPNSINQGQLVQVVQQQNGQIPTQQQNAVVIDSQKYVSAKAPIQEFHQVIPTTGEQQQQQQQHLENNPNYYSYYHDATSVEQPYEQQHVILTTHPQSSPIPQSHNVLESQPQNVDVYASAAAAHPSPTQASTTSPDIISISRSKKMRSRTSSANKSVPISKPSSTDAQYDTLVDNLPPSYDTFEPRPSSSITNSHSNRLHHGTKTLPKTQKIRTTSTRIPLHQTYTTTAVTSKRPTAPIFPHRIRNNNNIYPEELLYPSPKKSYRDYNHLNENNYQVTDNMRLSLPFEPTVPHMGRGRYGNHGGNYSTPPSSHNSLIRQLLPLRTSSSVSNSHRSNLRRPLSSSHSVSSHPHHHQSHHTSSRNYHQHHNQHPNHNEEEKEYTIEDSYSQHVRLSLPTKPVVTQLLPKSQKVSRNRQPGQGRGKTHHHQSDANLDYYYANDDSPVEIKVPRMKAHESHSSRTHHHQPHHQQLHNHNSPSHLHNSNSQEMELPNFESERYQSSPTNYLRRKPSSGDFNVRPTSQTYLHEGLDARSNAKSSNGNNGNSHHQQEHLDNNQHLQQPAAAQAHHQHHHHHHHRPSTSSSMSSSTRTQNHGKTHQIQFISKPSGRRSHSRAFQFNTNTLANGEVVTEAYEYASPTARPAYFVSHSQNNQHQSNTQHQHSNEERSESHLQNSNEFINAADMELKRMEPRHGSRGSAVKTKNNNSSDILHSVSISISSKISHSREDSDPAGVEVDQHNASPTAHQVIEESPKSIEGEEEDYDIYSPKFTNYHKSTTTPSSIIKLVPIPFSHIKPNEMSSFMPARSIIDEDEEDELG